MSQSASTSREPASVRCPRCGRAFDCGRHTDPFDCWCQAMPAVQADRLVHGMPCLCPECLADDLASAQARPTDPLGPTGA
ncbi:cysteine-rich CWC family protein [Paraburkholderia kururiensis]|uniref:Cysteine-rich CWC family protein n=1 Tax=Paraburkholderia kururiensis TaxID=984307 RepID=A0ABZ0WUJ3_9BURK|nr:cysteine-rich CWC family protein [Paraburkholderia kururiensis]WQD81090.1 cysteine-rich CWC family protein [Paraburkholderia kururiensis]